MKGFGIMGFASLGVDRLHSHSLIGLLFFVLVLCFGGLDELIS